MNIIRTSAPGKLILIGEHAVVYGKPAIITAVNKRCFVTISKRDDKKIKINSKNFSKEIVTDFDEIIAKFNKAQNDWKIFDKNGDVEVLKAITAGALDYPQIIIGQFIDCFKSSFEGITPHPNPLLKGEGMKGMSGFDLEIDSEIPVGAGMGSSAGLAVSIIGALFLFTNTKFDKDAINKIAFLCEQKKHGRPSGGDNAASCFGGLILFKKNDGVKQLDLNLPIKLKENFYVINTGAPEESTGEMVSMVKELYENDPVEIRNIFDDQGELVNKMLEVISSNYHENLTEIVKRAEYNLEKIGVVSESTKDLIRKVEESGGSAKICGAGGRADRSGIILIYHENLQRIKNVLESYNLEAEQLELGSEGLRIEI